MNKTLEPMNKKQPTKTMFLVASLSTLVFGVSFVASNSPLYAAEYLG